MTISDTPAAVILKRRTLEDKAVRWLADHAGKIYLGLLVLAVLVIQSTSP